MQGARGDCGTSSLPTPRGADAEFTGLVTDKETLTIKPDELFMVLERRTEEPGRLPLASVSASDTDG